MRTTLGGILADTFEDIYDTLALKLDHNVQRHGVLIFDPYDDDTRDRLFRFLSLEIVDAGRPEVEVVGPIPGDTFWLAFAPIGPGAYAWDDFNLLQLAEDWPADDGKTSPICMVTQAEGWEEIATAQHMLTMVLMALEEGRCKHQREANGAAAADTPA